MMDFVAIDFETANRSMHPCQIGAVLVISGKIAKTYSTLINPESRFDSICTKVHGIDRTKVLDAPTFDQVYQWLYPLLRHYPAVAHSAGFDRGVFLKSCTRYNLPAPKMTWFCTEKLCVENYPQSSSYRLDDLCAARGIPLENHHNATQDATACANLFLTLLKDESTAIFPINPPNDSVPSPDVMRHATQREKEQATLVEPRVQYDSLEELTIEGRRFVLTGDYGVVQRDALEDFLKSKGAEVASSLSKKVDYLIVGSLDPSVVIDKVSFKSTKIIKAEQLRDAGAKVKIIHYIDFLKQLQTLMGGTHE